MTKFNHKAAAKRFIKACQKAGASVDWTIAGTGSMYVTVSGDEGQIKVRFADHGECYCSEDISVDPEGCDYAQAINATMRETGIDLSATVRALEAAATREATRSNAFDAKITRRDAAAAKYMAAHPAASRLDAYKATVSEWNA